jgi:hypothetical protein
MHSNMLSSLQDTERILQILTNAHFVETKTSSSSNDLQQNIQDAPEGEVVNFNGY